METGALIISGIMGFFLPFVTGLLSKASWSNGIKFIIVIVCATLAGIATLAIQGEFNDLTWQTVYSHIGIVYVHSAVSFWWIISRIPSLKEWLYAHLIHD